MTAKEYLQQIQKQKNTIQKKESELFLLECLATSTTAPTDREAVQTSGTSDKVGNSAVKIAMLKEDIGRQKEQAQAIIIECIGVVEQVRALKCDTAEVQYNILHKRYVSGKKLKKIAEEETYSYDYIRELHGIALQNVKKLMPKEQLPTQTHIFL